MKFCRRAEGTVSARSIFKKAREDTRTTYHVYVAAALMEYYCTKDKKIAGNVFELGFKKFKDNHKYVLEYIEFLSHLNEDNNTRVLFERALTSGSLEADQTVDIWNKFIEFETNVGDLPGIKKVEKRRGQAFDLSETLMSCPTARLIDRYRFNELFPCTRDELSSMGYESSELLESLKNVSGNVLLSGSGLSGGLGLDSNFTTQTNTSGSGQIANASNNLSKDILRPDVFQMVPFKPKFKWITGEHRLPGGGFPLPPAAELLCQTLPPPDSFQGPFVVVDRLMDVFMNMRLPSDFVSPSFNGNGMAPSSRLFDTAKSASWSATVAPTHLSGTGDGGVRDSRSMSPSGSIAEKRRRTSKSRSREPRGSDDDDDSNLSAPANDIYRQRQQKRMK